MRSDLGNPVVAILTADWHLSERPPVARSGEPDWYAAMARPLKELSDLSLAHDCPVIVAGDIFHRHNPGPELINWTLENMPSRMHSVPGQHDLPYHRLEDWRKSAYGTLLLSCRMSMVRGPMGLSHQDLILFGFPWGVPLVPCDPMEWENQGLQDRRIRLAVVHSYLWKKGCGHPDASEESRIGKVAVNLKGYHAAVFGDNHVPFDYVTKSGCSVCNVGSLMRRNADQEDYRPSVGLLHRDGTVTRHPLDVSKDVFDAGKAKAKGVTAEEFIGELKHLEGKETDYQEAVKRKMERDKVRQGVKEVALRCMGEDKK